VGAELERVASKRDECTVHHYVDKITKPELISKDFNYLGFVMRVYFCICLVTTCPLSIHSLLTVYKPVITQLHCVSKARHLVYCPYLCQIL